MVHYRSTRGGVRGLSFEQAVLTGLAADRGLLVPEAGEFPTLPADALDKWASLSYQELAAEVMGLFIDESEISRAQLRALVAKSYNSSTFRAEEVAPVVKVTDQMLVLELFHGPTFAFKDIALQFLGNLFEFFLQRKNKALPAGAPKHQITVVGATSGDTGSSAIYGLRGKENVEVFILFPEGRVSAIQQRQMTTVLDENIHNVAVKGTFDDCQAIVKDLFANADFKAKSSTTSGPTSAREHGVTGEIAFSVPTGNFGDILAGFYAKKLGVPIGKLIVATNENDILHRFFSTGKYHRRDIEHTISPSMDICVSSNFERYLFALSGENHDILRGWMQGFEQTNELTISGELLTKAQDEMASYAVLQDEVRSTIAEYKKVHRYLYDPHSAIGAAAAMHYGQDALTDKPNSAVVVVGTAHYGKFLPVVSKALGVAETEIQQHPILKSLESLPTRLAVANNSSATVAEHIRKTIAKKNQKACGDCFSLWSSAPTECKLATFALAAATVAAAFLVARRSK
ncbi:Threonine synthase [Phytophthora cinnamomi]|uniref:Threonine synthase n=1 Tax=Phytophthora cinnamomi TaxID=4785 RepID=UPI003559FDB5|nr:Threonine synthase [Phytophthora cinnamomi]